MDDLIAVSVLPGNTLGTGPELPIDAGRQLGLELAALGAAPFLAGALLARSEGLSAVARAIPCPIYLYSGRRCPACGSSRAFAAFARNEPSWRRDNPVAVAYAAAALMMGLVLAALPRRSRDALAQRFDRSVRALRDDHRRSIGLAVGFALPAYLLSDPR